MAESRGDRDLAAELVRGAAAGAVATLAMSVAMLAANRLGWMPKHPPERVVERAAEATETPATHGEVELAASLAHIGFGAAGGAAYGVAASRLALPDGA